MYNVIFVCTGNTCRSPMAEGVFKSLTEDYKDYLNIESRGLSCIPGAPPSDNAVIVLKEKGIDIKGHKAQDLSNNDIDKANKIVAMSLDHYYALFPVCKNKLYLLGDGIEDPFLKDEDGYRTCLGEIEKALIDALNSDVFYSLEKMTENDLKDAREIEKNSNKNPWSENIFKRELEKSYSFNTVIKYLGKTAGFISGENISGEMNIGSLAVDENFRRKGLASRLLEDIIKKSEDLKCDLITLEVRVNNAPAINLYKKFEFKVLGERKDYYDNPKEDALIMTKYIN